MVFDGRRLRAAVGVGLAHQSVGGRSRQAIEEKIRMGCYSLQRSVRMKCRRPESTSAASRARRVRLQLDRTFINQACRRCRPRPVRGVTNDRTRHRRGHRDLRCFRVKPAPSAEGHFVQPMLEDRAVSRLRRRRQIPLSQAVRPPPVGQIAELLARSKGIRHHSVRSYQRQKITPAPINPEIRVHIPRRRPPVFSGSKNNEEFARCQHSGWENPSRQIGRIISQTPARQIHRP